MFSAMTSVLSNPMARAKWGGYVLRMIFVALALFFAYFPIVWIASASINETGTLNTQRLIPRQSGFENYHTLLGNEITLVHDVSYAIGDCVQFKSNCSTDFTGAWHTYRDNVRSSLHPYGIWMWNSIKVSTITAVLSVIVGAFGAYAFSRFRFTGRRNLMLTIFLVQVFPNSLTIVATFLLVNSIGKHISWLGLNSHGGLILVYLGGALGINTWLMKGFFDSIPRDLDESAKIDGASDWRIFWQIIFPLVRPILAVVAILSFIGTYGDVIISLTLLKDKDVQTLAIGLNRFIADEFNENWGVFSAGALIGAIPIVVLILTFQRFLVSGLTEGSVKG